VIKQESFFHSTLLCFACRCVALASDVALFHVVLFRLPLRMRLVTFCCVIAKSVLTGKAAKFRPPLRG